MTVPPTTSRVEPRSGGVADLVRAHPLVAFFVCSYAVTWLLWSPLVLTGTPAFNAERHAPSLAVMPGIAIGVTGTAFVLTAVTQGRAGVRRLVQRLLTWRAGVGWFAVAVLLLPLSSMAVTAALGAPDVLKALTPGALLLYPAAYAVHFFFGPLFEETGWRGFALPRMQHRFGPLRGSLLLGVLWSAWHFFLYVPVWFAGGAIGGLLGVGIFTLTTTTMTLVFTWLSNHTRASLLLCVLLHGSVDGTTTYFSVLADRGTISPDAAADATGTGQLIALVVLAVVLLGATRAKLGYARYRATAEALDLDPAARGRVG